MNKYIAVTIGPIFDTINLTSSPAALWAASYMFSTVSKTLCEVLTENKIAEDAIISPYYKKDDELLNKKDGIGLFHDRVIFKSDGLDISEFNKIKATVIERVSALFNIDYSYLQEYLMISAVALESDNPIMDSDAMLNCSELQKSYIFSEKENPIISLFLNDRVSFDTPEETKQKTGKNEAIKALVTQLNEFQLMKNDGNLKSLYDIVCTGKGYKKYKYYVIVRSDGDNMSEIIKSLANNDQTREFSKTCLDYCYGVSQIVKEYEGITIYSGGDDLLAILPCESRQGKTIFDFVDEANKCFDKSFTKYNKQTSLSFGITIAYYKYPLYESLENSCKMLFDVAKKAKNGIALNLQKHSGQSAEIFIPNNALSETIALKNDIMGKLFENSDVLLSASNKLMQFKECFENFADETILLNLFSNIFDADSHQNNDFLHERLPRFFQKLRELGIRNACCEDNTDCKTVLAMCSLLRILKFFIEKEENAQ